MVSSKCKMGLEISFCSLEESNNAREPQIKTTMTRIPVYRLARVFHWRMSESRCKVPTRSPFMVTCWNTCR